MWKIYKVTNGLGVTLCNDIATARRVLACIQREIESNCDGVEIVLGGDTFSYKLRGMTEYFTFRIEEVEVWNTVPDYLKKYDYV